MNAERQAKREKWTEILRSWEDSKMNAAAYCRKNDIPSWQFHYWKKNLLSSDEEESDDFIAFPFAGSHQSRSGLWFELSSGLRLVIESGFNADELLRVLKVVGSGEC